jgi:AcrR family transcriptional regulator
LDIGLMSTAEPKPYHHGELRQALLQAANSIIRESGMDALSMRRLADQVGVSRTAPYHHFKDKNELLCAIAELGFADQDRMIRAILDDIGAGGGVRLFANCVHAYIRFAHESPETYDLMYGKEIWQRGEATPALRQVSKASFRMWVDLVGKWQQQKVLPGTHSALRTAQACWATLHGLARLLIDGVYIQSDDLDEIANTAVEILTQRTGGEGAAVSLT